MVVSVGTMFSEVGLFWYSFKQSRVGQYHGFLGRKPVCISPLNTYSASIQGFPPLPSPHALIPTHSPQTPLTLVQELHHSDLLHDSSQFESSHPKPFQFKPSHPKTLPTASFSIPTPPSPAPHIPAATLLPGLHSRSISITTLPTPTTASPDLLPGMWLYKTLMPVIFQNRIIYTPSYPSFQEDPRLHCALQACWIARKAHQSCR